MTENARFLYRGCVAVLAAAVLSGCVTKQYGRQEALTDGDRQVLACGDIDRELVRVNGWTKHVEQRSEYDGWDVLAIVGDFGIGNTIERGEALKSAEQRKDQLWQLRAAKACTGPVVGEVAR